MLRFSVLLFSVLTAFSLSAALGPGAETPITPPAYAALPGSQMTLTSATDGTDFLALWREETPGREGVYATIVSETSAKRPLVPQPIFRAAPNEAVGVSAVWTGNSYLVLLSRYYKPNFLVRLNRDGEPISPLQRIDLGTQVGFTTLAWNGSRVLLVWRSLSGTRAMLLDGEGNIVRTGIALPDEIRYFTQGVAADSFIVAWPHEIVPQEGSTLPLTVVRALRISAEGDVSAPVELMPQQRAADVGVASASNGSEVGVIVATRVSADTVIRRYTIDAALTIDAEPPLALPPYVNSITMVATPRGFVVSFLGINNETLTTVAFGSTTFRTIALPFSPGYGLFTVTNGRTVLAFWGTYPARAAAFDASLTRLTSDIFPIPTAPVRQEKPVVASAGNTGAIAWYEFGALKMLRFDHTGTALDSQPIVIAENADSYYRHALVFTGQLWLIAWPDQAHAVNVQRISSEGVLLGEPLTLDIPYGDLALASNGNVTALVASSVENRPGIRLVRFSPAGERLDPSPILLTEERSTGDPVIASNGEEFLVVWRWSRGYSPRVYGKRLDASGNPIETEPIVIANAPDSSQWGAQVASRGSDFIVAYVKSGLIEIYDPPLPDAPRPEPERVFAKRVLRTGVLADTTSEQDGTFIGLGTTPAITADGNRYVVTYRKKDDDAMTLFAAPLDGAGAPLSAPRLLVRAESYLPEHGITSIGNSLWTTYGRVVPELANVQRVFLREVTEQESRRRGSRN
jgi:hypothetical protein